MEAPKFTDEELNAIAAVMPKADPMVIIAPIQSIITKIAAYFEGLQKEQAVTHRVADGIAEKPTPKREADVPVIDTSPSRNRTKAVASKEST